MRQEVRARTAQFIRPITPDCLTRSVFLYRIARPFTRLRNDHIKLTAECSSHKNRPRGSLHRLIRTCKKWKKRKTIRFVFVHFVIRPWRVCEYTWIKSPYLSHLYTKIEYKRCLVSKHENITVTSRTIGSNIWFVCTCLYSYWFIFRDGSIFKCVHILLRCENCAFSEISRFNLY